jgi:site-specific DNA-methyltransferase (adenine-specific)
MGEIRGTKNRKLDNQDVVPKFNSVKEYSEFTKKWMTVARAYLKPTAVMVIWTNFLGKQPIISTAKSLGYGLIGGEYLWCKHASPTAAVGKLSSNECLLRVYEAALIFQREEFPAPTRLYLANAAWSVVTAYQAEGSLSPHEHPCHKPSEALRPLISSWYKFYYLTNI